MLKFTLILIALASSVSAEDPPKTYCGIECESLTDPVLTEKCIDLYDRLFALNNELVTDFNSFYKCEGVITTPQEERDAWIETSMNSVLVEMDEITTDDILGGFQLKRQRAGETHIDGLFEVTSVPAPMLKSRPSHWHPSGETKKDH